MSTSISIALGAPRPRRAARVLARLRAHGLDGRLAERPELRRFGSAPVQRYQVIDAAGLMRRLIALLRGPQAVSPRGVAIARLLLSTARRRCTPARRAGPWRAPCARRSRTRPHASCANRADRAWMPGRAPPHGPAPA
jgi:hypothetical protein